MELYSMEVQTIQSRRELRIWCLKTTTSSKSSQISARNKISSNSQLLYRHRTSTTIHVLLVYRQEDQLSTLSLHPSQPNNHQVIVTDCQVQQATSIYQNSNKIQTAQFCRVVRLSWHLAQWHHLSFPLCDKKSIKIWFATTLVLFQ